MPRHSSARHTSALAAFLSSSLVAGSVLFISTASTPAPPSTAIPAAEQSAFQRIFGEQPEDDRKTPDTQNTQRDDPAPTVAPPVAAAPAPTTKPKPAPASAQPAPGGGRSAAAPTVKVPGVEVWASGLESGLAGIEAGDWDTVAADAPKIVGQPTRTGGKAIQMNIPAGASTDSYGARSEVTPKMPDLKEGDDYYLGVSMFLKNGFPVNESWQAVTQVKSQVDGSPPLELDVEDGVFKMCGGGGRDKPFCESLGSAVTGKWIDWMIHVKMSTDSGKSLVQVWRDGKSVLGPMHPPGATMYPGGDGYFKFGYYRKSGIAEAGTVTFDNLTVRKVN